MKINLLLPAALSVLIFPAARAGAAEPLTLQEAIRQGLAQNPTLRRLDAAVDAASWKRRESVAGFLPSVTVEGTHFLDGKYTYLDMDFLGEKIVMPSAYPGTHLDVSARWTFFDGFRSLKGVQAGNLEKRAAEYDREDAAFRLERQIQMAFYQALAAQALLDVARKRVASLEELHSITLARENHGAGTRYDRLRVETQWEEATASQSVAEDNVTLSRKHLTRVMGLDRDERPVRGELPVPDAKALPATLRAEDTQRADLKALDARARALDKQSGIPLSGYWPSASLFGTKSFYKYGSFDPAVLTNADYQTAYEVGLSLRWEPFDGGADYAKSREAKASAEGSRQALRDAKLQSSEDVEVWSRRYLDQAQLYAARQRNIERAAESLRLAKIGLKEGTQTHLDVLDAEADLDNARAGSIQSQVDAAEALLRLEIALGRSLR